MRTFLNDWVFVWAFFLLFFKPRSIILFTMRWICTASTGGDAMAPVKIENLTLDM